MPISIIRTSESMALQDLVIREAGKRETQSEGGKNMRHKNSKRRKEGGGRKTEESAEGC